MDSIVYPTTPKVIMPVPATERYAEFTENEFLDPKSSPLSTFSLDVDTSSYTLMRRAIADQKQLPPRTSVRIEEYVNYFHYDYPEPQNGDPIAVINNLSEFIFGLIRAVGLILLGWGIVQVGLSFSSHDPSQRSNGFLTLAGGVVITFTKEILNMITG
jgi:hypothetical protein